MNALAFLLYMLSFFGLVDYNGATNEWTLYPVGVVGCSEYEDSDVIPCVQPEITPINGMW